MSDLPACMCVCWMCREVKKHWCPGTVVTDIMNIWKQNPGPLEELAVLSKHWAISPALKHWAISPAPKVVLWHLHTLWQIWDHDTHTKYVTCSKPDAPLLVSHLRFCQLHVTQGPCYLTEAGKPATLTSCLIGTVLIISELEIGARIAKSSG